ncbi:hypothetical protein JNW90_13205 [Micromonospora sp. STR1s_5]|nr:hypothetical protein [Micromonospora sp. STR1s_5]
MMLQTFRISANQVSNRDRQPILHHLISAGCFVLVQIVVWAMMSLSASYGLYLALRAAILFELPSDIRGSHANYSRSVRVLAMTLSAAAIGAAVLLLFSSAGSVAFD